MHAKSAKLLITKVEKDTKIEKKLLSPPKINNDSHQINKISLIILCGWPWLLAIQLNFKTRKIVLKLNRNN